MPTVGIDISRPRNLQWGAAHGGWIARGSPGRHGVCMRSGGRALGRHVLLARARAGGRPGVARQEVSRAAKEWNWWRVVNLIKR